MDCGETRTRLAAFHDGELAPADRAPIEEHLRVCGECRGILDRLAKTDANVDVPDPGPEYWERFNRRVMERVEKEAPVPAEVAPPRRGWAWRRMPYFIPAVAAAALLLVVVRQTGMDPFSRTTAPPPAPQAAPREISGAAPQAVPPPPVSRVPERSMKTTPPVSRPAGAGKAATPQAVLSGGIAGSVAPPAPGSPSVSGERIAAAPGGEKELFARSDDAGLTALSAPSEESFRGGASTAPTGGVKAERAAPREREEKRAVEGKADRTVSKSTTAAAPAAAVSPCESARTLAGRGLLEEAESAQRACLARSTAPEAQESGMVFLAELLDRQSRIAEADTVLRETERQFPGSRPLGAYLRQRSHVQGRRFQ